MKVLFVLAVLVAAVAAVPKSYNGYKTYRVVPTSRLELAMLSVFQRDDDIDFWTAPRAIHQEIDIMVGPKTQLAFESFLKDNKIPFSVLINNVETIVAEERTRIARAAKVPQGKITFTQYHRYEAIQDYLHELVAAHPSIASMITLGMTTERRPLTALKISTGGNGKPAILVDGGIHAREWIAPAMVLYIINQLVENSANADMIEKVDWYIVPVLNPDGYEYSHTTERFWRKTRSPGIGCYGTDANRNFDFHWMEVGASSNECSETYAGPYGFSEPETQALRDFVITNAGAIKLYLTFHSYGQYLLYPWGYTSALPDDAQELQNVAARVNDAISAVAGTEYTIGSSTNVLYPAAGGSDDWVKGVGGVQLSYTIELPGGGSNGFDLPPSRIRPVVEETFEGVKVYHTYIKNKFT